MATPGFLTVGWLSVGTGVGSATAAARSYVRFVEAGIDQIRAGATAVEPVARPCPGDAETRDRLAQCCEAAARDTEIPRAERYATGPSLATLFEGVGTRAERDTRAASAVRDHGYAMKAVADFIGRHYVTMSRAVARAERQTAAPKMSECKT